MEDRNNINKFRKKKKQRRFMLNFAVVLLIGLVIILIATNWSSIISPFKDAALEVGTGGFPVDLPGSTGYELEAMGDNFCLLTDTYLYTYNSDGANIAGIQHGFQNPAMSVNQKRALVYDRNGKSFKFYSRSEQIYSNTLGDSIVFAEVGSSDRSAVVTTSTRYANYLYVFNSEGKQIFRWASPENKIMQVCFSDDDNSIFVSVIGERGGDLRLSILRFDLDNSEDMIWQTDIGSDITFSLEYCRDGLYVVSGGGNMLLDKNSGEITAQSHFTKTVSGIPDSDGMRAVVFHDTATNLQVVTVYNDALEAGESLPPEKMTSFMISGGKLYVMSGNFLYVYNSALEQTAEYELDDVYSDFKVIGSSAYLLGYNTVQKLAL